VWFDAQDGVVRRTSTPPVDAPAEGEPRVAAGATP
jgi:hypothetical protein